MFFKVLKYIGLIYIIFFVQLLILQSVKADSSLDLQKKLGHIQSLKADFQQQVKDELGSIVDSSSGLFELQRPMLFRWVVKDPYEQELVSDGKDLWQFDQDIEQINVSDLEQSFANSPAALLSKTQLNIAQDYKVTSTLGQTQGHVLYYLTPKDPEALFEMMIMEFASKELVAMRVTDNLGQTTLVEFNNVEYNQEFDNNHFKFLAPEGIDIIDGRNKNSQLRNLTESPQVPVSLSPKELQQESQKDSPKEPQKKSTKLTLPEIKS